MGPVGDFPKKAVQDMKFHLEIWLGDFEFNVCVVLMFLLSLFCVYMAS